MPMSEPVEQSTVDVFSRSLQRCLGTGAFISAFYEQFLASSDEVRERFAGTDFARQRQVLARSLQLMSRAALGQEDGEAHLELIARGHSRKGLDIAPRLYNFWLESLIATMRTHDPEFDPGVERAWRELLQRSINRMVTVYRELDTVPPSIDRR